MFFKTALIHLSTCINCYENQLVYLIFKVFYFGVSILVVFGIDMHSLFSHEAEINFVLKVCSRTFLFKLQLEMDG